MLSSLLYRGEVAEVARRVPHLLLTAVEQGNLFAATDLRTRMNLIWLAADNPTRAREEVIAALKAWPQEGFHLQHFSSMMALAQIELYTGDFEVVWKHLEGHLQPLEQSMLLRIQILRIEARHLRARAALASASGRDREARLKIAANLARKIQKEELQWADPLASLIWAGLAVARRNDSGAKAFLSQALEGFLVADMELYAAATRRRLGLLIGEARGRQLVAQADEWMSQQQILNPERMTQMLIPGFE